MQAFIVTKTFIGKLGDSPYPFVAPGDLARVTPYEIYLDTRQGQKRIAASAEKTGVECRVLDPAQNPSFTLPITLNGHEGRPTLLPLDPQIAAQLRARIRPGQPLRLALFNALGTGLGDNLVGAQAFRLVLPLLKAIHPLIEVDVIRSWTATKPDYVLKHEPWVTRIRTTPIRLDEWREYDACFDFSGCVSLPGFRGVPWPDFHLINLGVAPEKIAPELKQASCGNINADDFARGVAAVIASKPQASVQDIFVHATASTPLRSIPAVALLRLCTALKQQSLRVVTDDNAVVAAAQSVNCPCLMIRDRSLSELYGAVSAVDSVVSCNSFLLHVANAVGKPTVDLLMGQGGYQHGMLPYQPLLTSIQVDRDHRYWDQYKLSADVLNTPAHKAYFESCWLAAIEQVIHKVIKPTDTEVPHHA
ncbi:hypothetical protein CFI10_17100 [Marinobacterium iners]|uniref:glycosyltransferase family 9 protein n=1 Tax=Marinobacterium iners TaxID=48076 RepID=UPI001A8C53CB|nr:hypothetical protein [Marinobacterium iners]QSR36665.1 hypothetical protein CFI10_17100 [Marinobacterium iners]